MEWRYHPIADTILTLSGHPTPRELRSKRIAEVWALSTEWQRTVDLRDFFAKSWFSDLWIYNVVYTVGLCQLDISYNILYI